MDLYPTDGTFIKFERWKALQPKNLDITLPEEAINEQNWHKVSKSLDEIQDIFESELGDFIHGTSQKKVDEILNGLK